MSAPATTVTAGSAYPVPVAELVSRARELAERLGEVPSRNRLMSELRIGARKARTVLDELTTELTTGHTATDAHGSDPTPEPAPETVTAGAGSVAELDSVPSAANSERHEITAAESEPDTQAELVSSDANPDTASSAHTRQSVASRVRSWPVLLLALPAFVAIWSGWVGLGGLTGFGIVHPLPGIADGFALNTAITLPIGVEAYAAYALRVWLSGQVPAAARQFAKVSALGSLTLGALGQVAYHLMEAAAMHAAPWWITTLVACLPVAVLGMGAALAHLIHNGDEDREVPA